MSSGRIRKVIYLDELPEEEQKKIRHWELKESKYKDGTVRYRVYTNKTKPAYYCFLRDHKVLRKVMVQRKREIGCKWKDVEAAIGIKNPTGKKCWRFLKGYRGGLSQMQILFVCELLGIDVDLKITLLEKWKEIPKL